MPTLYQGDRELIVGADEVKEFEDKGWSKSKSSPKPQISKPKVEKVEEKVEPPKEAPKSTGTRNKFKTGRG